MVQVSQENGRKNISLDGRNSKNVGVYRTFSVLDIQVKCIHLIKDIFICIILEIHGCIYPVR
jgi:hypothetical protein